MTDLKWSGRCNEGGETIKLNCRMEEQDMRDAIAQIAEQMGDEKFMEYVNWMMA